MQWGQRCGNWEVWNTGGGCDAWGLNLPSGGYALVTHWNDPSTPSMGQRCCVGLYDSEGDWIDEKLRYSTYYGPVTLERIEARLLSAPLDREVR